MIKNKMADSRTRRRINHLECLIVENAKKVAEINAIKHRVNNNTALRQDQINLLHKELNLIIEDRNTAVHALNGVEKLEFIERTTSYENLKASILHASEVESHLKPLLNRELDDMEKDLKNEKLQFERELLELRGVPVRRGVATYLLSFLAYIYYFSLLRRVRSCFGV